MAEQEPSVTTLAPQGRHGGHPDKGGRRRALQIKCPHTGEANAAESGQLRSFDETGSVCGIDGAVLHGRCFRRAVPALDVHDIGMHLVGRLNHDHRSVPQPDIR